MILQAHAAEERIADVVPLIRGERIADRSLDVEIAPADAPRERRGDNPSRSVGESGDAGWRLSSDKSAGECSSHFLRWR